MKYIIPFITCFLMLVACTKESDYSAPEGTIYTPRKNAFRATKISGTSTHWGNFTLYLEYDKEELNSIIRTNTQGDTVQGISPIRCTITCLPSTKTRSTVWMPVWKPDMEAVITIFGIVFRKPPNLCWKRLSIFIRTVESKNRSSGIIRPMPTKRRPVRISIIIIRYPPPPRALTNTIPKATYT